MMDNRIDIDERRNAVYEALAHTPDGATRWRPLAARDLSPVMRRDAAITLLGAWRVALNYGLTLNDASVNCLRMDRDGQIYFDGYDSLVLRAGTTPPLLQAFRQLIGPLLLIARDPELAFLVQRAGPVNPAEFTALTRPVWRHVAKLPGGKRILISALRSRFAPLLMAGLWFRFARAVWSERRRQSDAWLEGALDALIARVRDLPWAASTGKWTGYYEGINLSAYADGTLAPSEALRDQRERTVFKLLDSELPSTVLDMAANQGLFSLISHRAGHTVIAVDNDVGAVDELYRMTRTLSLPIRPAVFDFLTLGDDSIDRLRSPIVLALGFTHHLYLVEGLDWPRIARNLASLTEQVLITEFKLSTGAQPATSPIGQSWLENYRCESLETALRVHFEDVEVVRPEPEANRVLLVCRRPMAQPQTSPLDEQ